MEDYPPSYVLEARPLVVLSGIGIASLPEIEHTLQQNGPTLLSNASMVVGALAEELLSRIFALGAAPFRNISAENTTSFKFQICGRVRQIYGLRRVCF